MPTIKISELTEITTKPQATDIVPVVDTSESSTKKITVDTLAKYVDSDHVRLRQDYAYASLTGVPTVLSSFNNDTLYLDSDTVVGVIDATYVQTNQTPQDFAYASLTGAPTSLAAFTNDPKYLDSNTVVGVIDATYVQANQIKYDTSNFTDSAYVAAQINSLIGGAPGTLDTLNEIALALGNDDNAYGTLISLINAMPDSAQVGGLIDSAVSAGLNTAGNLNVDGVTTLDSTTIDGPLKLEDNRNLIIGTDDDLLIYHDAVSTYTNIDCSSPQLRVFSDDFRINSGNGFENLASFSKDGSVDLYYNNSKKFETTNAGVTIDGDIRLDSAGTSVGNIGKESGTLYIQGNPTSSGVLFGNVDIYPWRGGSLSDDSVSLGTSSQRFKDLYLSRAIVQTLDVPRVLGTTIEFSGDLADIADTASRTITLNGLGNFEGAMLEVWVNYRANGGSTAASARKLVQFFEQADAVTDITEMEFSGRSIVTGDIVVTDATNAVTVTITNTDWFGSSLSGTAGHYYLKIMGCATANTTLSKT